MRVSQAAAAIGPSSFTNTLFLSVTHLYGGFHPAATISLQFNTHTQENEYSACTSCLARLTTLKSSSSSHWSCKSVLFLQTVGLEVRLQTVEHIMVVFCMTGRNIEATEMYTKHFRKRQNEPPLCHILSYGALFLYFT